MNLRGTQFNPYQLSTVDSPYRDLVSETISCKSFGPATSPALLYTPPLSFSQLLFATEVKVEAATGQFCHQASCIFKEIIQKGAGKSFCKEENFPERWESCLHTAYTDHNWRFIFSLREKLKVIAWKLILLGLAQSHIQAY